MPSHNKNPEPKSLQQQYLETSPTADQWEKAANRLARDYVIINSCNECGWPHIKGYCCTFCDSVDP